MAIIQWSSDLSVGVDTFDRHHKKLIDLINSLYTAMKSGKGKEVVGDILKSLSDYTRYHFGEEEKKMVALNYHGYTEHKAQHESFVNKIQEYINHHEKGSASISIGLMNFLSDWLQGHIKNTDKKYTTLFASRNVA